MDRSWVKNDLTTVAAREWLRDRGVTMEEIGELVMYLQGNYFPDLTMDECLESVEKVLDKREVQNAIFTGIQLDQLAEEGKLQSPLREMIESDEGLYGCDEILALSIVNVYGSIGLTNYGYIDKMKPGVLERLNRKGGAHIHTFLDDIVGAIAAAASSRIAHSRHS
ncbi:MAG: phosphatidylglycerophosphatase A [Paenibacillaceae bacterium]|nr:phosphatidylglycerophosphatase A [Paenibacillaceae bacterium]